MQFETISVVGLGYIGLPTAALFASRGVKVVGIDVNPVAVESINNGKIHIVEPGLEDVVSAAVEKGLLSAKLEAESADAFLIAVPTPIETSKKPDLNYIKAAAKSIAPVLKKGDLVILESTSPVGTTSLLESWLIAERPDLTFPSNGGEVSIAYCPERVLPGKILQELVSNDRIIGGLNSSSSKLAVQLYKMVVEGECIETDAQTAEMTKLTENSFRDLNIAFANELSLISDKFKIDVWELISLANRHPRVNILQPGPGVGGHCIAVDPWFIVSEAPEIAKLVKMARDVNDGKPKWVVNKVRTFL